MARMRISGGRVVDPETGMDRVTDVVADGGVIVGIGHGIPVEAGEETIDASGLVVAPGLIDLHVHLREPGQTSKETIQTGAAAAARGGFTTIVCMPNTSPSIDNAGTVALIRQQAEKVNLVRVEICGALTKGIAGEELAPIGSLKKAGIIAISDDGHCIQNNDLMRRALEYGGQFNLPVFDHCQDYSLVMQGVMHEGYWSQRLGLSGWPAAGEELIVARNILLAELTGTHVHCQHLGTRGSVRLLREAIGRGVPVSGEACPHHFTLTDAAVAGSDAFWAEDGQKLFMWEKIRAEAPEWPSYDTHFKMNPPLRSGEDREAILEAIADGTLSIIGSDHAPHCDFEKEVEFDYAPFGITGLENQLALSLMQLYHTGRMSLIDLLARFTTGPAKLLHLDDRARIRIGAAADFTLFNPDEDWVFRPDDCLSQSRNNPFNDWPLKGRTHYSIVGGRIVWGPDGLTPE